MSKKNAHLLQRVVRAGNGSQAKLSRNGAPGRSRRIAPLIALEKWLRIERGEARRDLAGIDAIDSKRQWFLGYAAALAAVTYRVARLMTKGARGAND